MSLSTKVLQEICDQVSGDIDAVVSIFGEKGEIIASSLRRRIGGLHPGAAMVMAGEVNSYEVTAEMAARDPAMLEGSTHPVDHDGERLFCVGVAAPLNVAIACCRLVQHWVVSLLRERALAWNEQRFRDVAESAGDWIWEMTDELRFSYVSPRFFEIFRVPPDAILGRTRAEFAGHGAGDGDWSDHEAKLLARLPFRDFAYSATTADGRTRHLKINGKPVYDLAGAFTGYRGTGSDVTEQVEAERALKRSEQLLTEAIETIPEGFSLYDRDDRLVIFNSKYPELLYPDGGVDIAPGMSFEEIIRAAAESGVIRSAEGRVEEWIRDRLARRREQREPHVQQRGENRWVLVSERKTADGGTVAVYSDITELKQRERELAEKSAAMEQLSTQLAKYLSPQVYDSIFTGRQQVTLASQRKKLTVFFSDIAEFTETAERLESEDLTTLLNQYLTEMSRIALAHGATIDKYVGDAIVIFFGDPESRGIREDALACARMALEMRGRMAELEDIWRDAGIEKPLRCRMGIHTGYCTVGNFGSEDRLDYTIIGGGVNLASRLESAAMPGQILVSYETYALVRDDISCAECGKMELKGIGRPVATYEIVEASAAPFAARSELREDQPNFRMRLNPDAMSGEERQQAAAALRRALRRVSDSPPPEPTPTVPD